jgi:hypothetical protein
MMERWHVARRQGDELRSSTLTLHGPSVDESSGDFIQSSLSVSPTDLQLQDMELYRG